MANGYNQYIGMRYVPIIDGVWSSSKAYEPLVVVTYNGNSYISKTYSPAGTLPTNEEYWILSANYNAQVEQYRQEVRQYQETVSGFADDIENLQTSVNNINNVELPADRTRLTNIEQNITNWIEVARNYGFVVYYKKSGNVRVLFIEGTTIGVIGLDGGHSFSLTDVPSTNLFTLELTRASNGTLVQCSYYGNTVKIEPIGEAIPANTYINATIVF